MLAGGIALMFVGWLLVTCLGTGLPHAHNAPDVLGAVCFTIGMGLAVASAVTAAWRYAP